MPFLQLPSGINQATANDQHPALPTTGILRQAQGIGQIFGAVSLAVAGRPHGRHHDQGFRQWLRQHFAQEKGRFFQRIGAMGDDDGSHAAIGQIVLHAQIQPIPKPCIGIFAVDARKIVHHNGQTSHIGRQARQQSLPRQSACLVMRLRISLRRPARNRAARRQQQRAALWFFPLLHKNTLL